jgi:phosphoribosylamine-glycine ligase
MLNRFLSGKKKYSVFIATFLVAVLQMFVGDPETQKELMDFVPTLAMMLSGIVYLVVEGRLDAQREKTNTAQAQAALVMANGCYKRRKSPASSRTARNPAYNCISASNTPTARTA